MSDEIISQENSHASNEHLTSEAAPSKQNETILKEVNVDAKSRQQTEKEEGDALKKVTRFKRKTCRFCANKDLVIDYKNVELLSKFITDRGKILPRRITGNCAKHQRIVAQQIKRARIIALLPFVVK